VKNIALASAPVASPAKSESASKPKVSLFFFFGIEEFPVLMSEQPCCVCKDEKAKRDECMLFSTAKNPAADCVSLVDQYKSCMQGFGFSV
jgi:cytochrome c oxidase assembly protein subunit 17